MINLVIPGEVICRVNEKVISGEGTYIYRGNLISKCVGTVVREEKPNGKVNIYISNTNNSKTPYIDAFVLARVTGITSNLVRAEIISVDDHVLEHTYKGILRKEAIRSYLRDQAEPPKSFGLGDIIRAKVLNITGSKSEGGFSYLLSTAEPKCGVIFAVNESNKTPLIPITESKMFCIKSRKIFDRKVAEVNRDFIKILTEYI